MILQSSTVHYLERCHTALVSDVQKPNHMFRPQISGLDILGFQYQESDVSSISVNLNSSQTGNKTTTKWFP